MLIFRRNLKTCNPSYLSLKIQCLRNPLMLFMDTSWHHRTTRMTFYALIEHLISDRKVQVRTNKICLLKISRPSLNIRKSVLTVRFSKINNRSKLNMVKFWYFHVSTVISKYSYEQISITYQIIHLLTKTTNYLTCM